MSNHRVQLDWRVPSAQWDEFKTFLSERTGRESPEFGRAIDRAMREFLEADEYEVVEDLLDELISAAGRRPADAAEKKYDREFFDDETERVLCYVDRDLKDAFRSYVKSETDFRHPGGALALALRKRCEGGRSGRIEEKLRRILPEVTSILSELNDSSDNGLTQREKKRIKIRHNLPSEFTQDDLVAEIESVAGETVVDAYAPKVLDELDYSEHPGTRDNPNRTLYVPSSRAEEIAREQAEERKRKADVQLDLNDATAIPEIAPGNADSSEEATNADAEEDADSEIQASQLGLLEDMSREDIEDLGYDPETVRQRLIDEGYDASALTGEADEDEGSPDSDSDAATEAPEDKHNVSRREEPPSETSRASTDGDGSQTPADADESPPALRADGGVVTDSPAIGSDLTAESPAPPTPSSRSIPPQVACTCCGSIIPTHVEVEVIDGVARKECPTCSKLIDIEQGVLPADE